MDELNSIMLGGDAFITKPYNTAILLAKIASLLRRAYASGQTEVLSWNGTDLHLESGFIEYSGRKADLTKNELKILYYLLRTQEKYVLAVILWISFGIISSMWMIMP